MYLLHITLLIILLFGNRNCTTVMEYNGTILYNNATLLARSKRQFVPNQQSLFHCSQYGMCFTYFVIPGAMTWYGAQNVCRQMGGTLFSPYTLEDVYYIMNAIAPYRAGTSGTNRSFWLGMMCQCQFANPFGCFQCLWADGRPVSFQAQPPNMPNDPKIGTLWSNMYFTPDHFARSLNGQMCLFLTNHWALYECNFADIQGGAVCQVPYGQGMAGNYGNGLLNGYGGFGKKKK